MSVNHDASAAAAAEQLIQRQAGNLALEVPKGGIDRGDGAHRNRTATPVRPTVQVLPDVLDSMRIPPHEARDDVILKVGHDGQFAAIQSGIANSIESGISP